MIQTTRDDIHVDDTIGMHIEPDAIHIMKRSEYSGEFGDYSSFSDEMDHISDASYNWEDENEEEQSFSKMLDKPYLLWSVLFIIVPLVMVVFYAFTDKTGAFTFQILHR